MLWKFPHDPHLIALNLVQLVTPIATIVTPAEGNFAETRKCSFTVTVAGLPLEIFVQDFDQTGMLTVEDWNARLDQLEADYNALVEQLTTPQQAALPPAEPEDDRLEGGLKDEVILVNSLNVTKWHNTTEVDGSTRLSLEAILPDHPQTDELIAKLMEYAHRVRMPDIAMDEPPLGSAAL